MDKKIKRETGTRRGSLAVLKQGFVVICDVQLNFSTPLTIVLKDFIKL